MTLNEGIHANLVITLFANYLLRSAIKFFIAYCSFI